VVPKTSEELLQRLDALDIAFHLYEHPAIPTVKDGAAHWASIPGIHCKNLFLRDGKKRYWLVTAPVDRQIRLNALATLIGASRLSFASPPRLQEVLGVEPGTVTPLALVNDAELKTNVIFDDWMMQQSLVCIHPLVNTATVSMKPQDLLRFIHHCGHSPCLVDLCDDGLQYPNADVIRA